MALRFLLIFSLTKQRRQNGVLESCHWALCRPLKHHYHHLPLFKECAEGITAVIRPTWISTQYSLVGHPHAHALTLTRTHLHAHADVFDFYKAIHIRLTWLCLGVPCLFMKIFTSENIAMNALKNTIIEKLIIVKITTRGSMEVQ